MKMSPLSFSVPASLSSQTHFYCEAKMIVCDEVLQNPAL